MAITDAQKSALNNMCISAQNAQIGNILQNVATIKTGTYTVVAADQTATTVSIPVGFTASGFIVSILRAGKDTTSLAAISASTTNLVVATNGASYVLTTGDVINYIVY
jgi:hypothetical protein